MDSYENKLKRCINIISHSKQNKAFFGRDNAPLIQISALLDSTIVKFVEIMHNLYVGAKWSNTVHTGTSRNLLTVKHKHT